MEKTRFQEWPRRIVACAFALCFVNATHAQQTSAGSSAAGTGVIPDTHGAIAEVLLHYDPVLAEALHPVYEDLFQGLSEDVRFKVLCPSREAAAEFADTWEPVAGSRDIEIVNVGLPISVWARDRCIARQSSDLSSRASTFVPSGEWTYLEVEKRNDLLLQDILGEARLAPGVLESPLHIEGGNIVSNRRHVFLGTNAFSENRAIDSDQLEPQLRKLFGRPYIAVGDKWGDVPWCHVDMYLTPIRQDTVLVASPSFAWLLLLQDGDPDTETSRCDDSVGHACPSDMLQEKFDDAAAVAMEHGYRVRRLPTIVNESEGWMITYNNVLLEERDGQSIVYMPVYDIPQLDRVAAAVYSGLGFEVRTVDVSELFANGGALRCVANVIQRRPPDALPETGTSEGSGCVRLVNLAGSRGYDGALDRSRKRLARRGRLDVRGVTGSRQNHLDVSSRPGRVVVGQESH